MVKMGSIKQWLSFISGVFCFCCFDSILQSQALLIIQFHIHQYAVKWFIGTDWLTKWLCSMRIAADWTLSILISSPLEKPLMFPTQTKTAHKQFLFSRILIGSSAFF